MAKLEPVHASLVADLVDLINSNLADLLKVRTVTCGDCHGRGTVGGETRSDGSIADDGTLATCATCGGVGAVERYEIDHAALKTYKYGRYVEGFEVKQGVVVPKFRSKTNAFNTLTKLLGFDKAVVEISNGATLSQTISEEQKAQYVEQLKELATMGLLDGGK